MNAIKTKVSTSEALDTIQEMAGHFGFRYLYSDQPVLLYFYAVPRLCLNLMGYWPGPKGTLPWRALLHFVILAIGVLTELHAGFQFVRSNQITLALETFCPAGTSAVTLLKMFLMLLYRQDLFYVVTQQRELLFPNTQQSTEKESILRNHSVMAARFNFWPLSAGFFTCTTYNLKPLLLALLLYIRGEEIAWETPFNMTMPHWLLSAPYFPGTYVFIAYTGYITIFMFGGCDAFYFEFCVHIGTLFKALQSDLRQVFRPYSRFMEITEVHAQMFEAALVPVIKRQNLIMSLIYFFRDRYWIITLAHFLSASMVIGFSIFDLLTVGGNGLGTLLYVGYTVAALSQLLIYCYGGTLVAESSIQVANVMAECPWYKCSPKHRRYIHFVIMRSQRAVNMAVPFFSPSLATFAAILQTSGSIIALAKSFQ